MIADKSLIVSFLFALLGPLVQGQVRGVGIGTTDPQAKLHVAGSMQYIPANIVATRLVGIDANGQLGTVEASTDFKIENNKLVITNDASDRLQVKNQSLSTNNTLSGSSYHNFDAGLKGVFETTPVFRFTGATSNYNITGFKDGVHGKHFFFLNDSSVGITFQPLNSGSLSQNQIVVAGDNGISGQGIAEFVYDGVSQKWILINIRN